MNVIVEERKGYKRLNFASLNFADEKEIDKEFVDDISPIHWTEDVLRGDRKVIVKNSRRNV